MVFMINSNQSIFKSVVSVTRHKAKPPIMGTVPNSDVSSPIPQSQPRQQQNLHSSRFVMSLLVPQSSIVQKPHEQPLSFVTLAQQRRFEEIIQRLESSDDTDTRAPREDKHENWLYGSVPAYSSPLYVLLQYQPPLSLVILLIQCLRRRQHSAIDAATDSSISTLIEPPETVTDESGRTPLHIACAFGCSVDVVARLLNGANTAQGNPIRYMQDNALMTPLHYACLAAGALRSESIDLANLAMVISLLVQVDPNGVKVTNNAGMMPIDFLTLNDQADKVIRPILSKAVTTLTVKQHETSKCLSVAARVAVTAVPNPQFPVPMVICCNDSDTSVVTELDVVTDLDVPAAAPYSMGCECSSTSSTALMTAASSTPSRTCSMATGSLGSIKGAQNGIYGKLDSTEATEWDWCPY